MGCGSSNPREGNERRNDKKQEFNLNLINDVNMRNYMKLIKNGLIFLDFSELKKNPQYDEIEGINLKGVKIIAKTINDKEMISKYLAADDKIMSLKKSLQNKNGNVELGIFFNNEELVFFIIIPTIEINYENEICDIFKKNNLPMSSTIELNDKIPIYLLLKLTNSLKQNNSVKTVILCSIIDDFLFKSIINNLITNVNIQKLKCSKLGLTEESVKFFDDYFKYNQNISKLKVDNNKLENFETIYSAIKDNHSLTLTSLNVSNNKFKNYQNLSKFLFSAKAIQKLNFSKILIKNEEDFNSIFMENLDSKFSNLTTLDLSFNFVSIITLTELVKYCKNLKKLTLQKIKFSDADLENLSNFSKSYLNSNVENLSINFENVNALKNFFMGGLENGKTKTLKKLKLFKSSLNEETTNIMCQALTINDLFKELDLSYCSISNFENFVNTLSNLKCLLTLNLSSCGLSQEHVDLLSTNFFPKTTIKNLELEKNNFSGVGAESMKKFCESLNENSSINKINFNYCFTIENNSQFSILCENLKMKNLNELSMENCEFHAESFGEKFAKLLSNNLLIKALKIGSKDEIFKPNININILKSLMSNKNLEDFTMSNIKVSGEAVKEFLNNGMKQLKSINFNNICGDTQFFELFPKISYLQNLNINMYSITDINHAKSIQELLKTNSVLESLILKISNLPAEVLDIIVEGLKTNTSIKKFIVFPQDLIPSYLPSIIKYYKYSNEKRANLGLEMLYFENNKKEDEKLINDAKTIFNEYFK